MSWLRTGCRRRCSSTPEAREEPEAMGVERPRHLPSYSPRSVSGLLQDVRTPGPAHRASQEWGQRLEAGGGCSETGGRLARRGRVVSAWVAGVRAESRARRGARCAGCVRWWCRLVMWAAQINGLCACVCGGQ
eukprot:scaffold30280_cov57-Phaeocystis_antarctica.AAC.5